MKKTFNSYSILLAVVLLFSQIIYSQTNINLTLGNPSNAQTDTSMSENYLMIKPQYSFSYNNTKHIPNWVSWHVCATDLGKQGRQNNFRSDSQLPAKWYRVSPQDYTSTGFDKGHQCPSGDRTNSVTNNSATFLMTNMVPQAPNNNRITWEQLEAYSRGLVTQGNELYIICGVSGQGGVGSKGARTTIGTRNVVVPAKTWKIVVVLPSGTKVNSTTRVISVLMPNTQDCSKLPWSNYRVSVDSIEHLTGYDFLSNIPKEIQKVIEAKVDSIPID